MSYNLSAILLDAQTDNFIHILIMTPIVIIVFWFIWNSEKIFGVKYKRRNAFEDPVTFARKHNEQLEEQHLSNIEELNNMDPEIIAQAILNIKNSIFANTSENILNEAKKLQRNKDEGPIEERIKNKLKGLFDSRRISLDNLDRLYKLYELKEKGIISEEEFKKEKSKIIK